MKIPATASLLAVSLALGVAPAPAAEAESEAESRSEVNAPTDEPEAQEAFFDALNNERLTGDWAGGRNWLEDQGIEFGMFLTTVYQHNAHGGVQTRNGHRLTGSADYELTFDLETMGVFNGGIVYIAAESSWNDGIGEDRVGSLFGVNGDAGGDEAVIVPELWYEQLFWNGKARFRLGKIDVTTDIDANAYANDETGQFLNPALINVGNAPFPDVGLGAQLVLQPVDWFYAAVVAADAQADGRETGLRTTFHEEDYFFGAFECGFLPVWKTSRGDLPGGYRVGLWYDPQPKEVFFDDLDGQLPVRFRRDDVGFYFNMDQMVWKEHPEDVADSQGLGVFFRYGYAHADRSELEHFWSVGAQYQGLFPTRRDDVLGFGFAQGILSHDLRALEGGDRESVYELYYNWLVFPWLTVTPDFQFVVNPGAAGGRDSFAAGLRVQMSL